MVAVNEVLWDIIRKRTPRPFVAEKSLDDPDAKYIAKMQSLYGFLSAHRSLWSPFRERKREIVIYK